MNAGNTWVKDCLKIFQEFKVPLHPYSSWIADVYLHGVWKIQINGSAKNGLQTKLLPKTSSHTLSSHAFILVHPLNSSHHLRHTSMTAHSHAHIPVPCGGREP